MTWSSSNQGGGRFSPPKTPTCHCYLWPSFQIVQAKYILLLRNPPGLCGCALILSLHVCCGHIYIAFSCELFVLIIHLNAYTTLQHVPFYPSTSRPFQLDDWFTNLPKLYAFDLMDESSKLARPGSPRLRCCGKLNIVIFIKPQQGVRQIAFDRFLTWPWPVPHSLAIMI